jgi:hypothetical protein
VDVLLSIRVSFVLVHGSVFVIYIFWDGVWCYNVVVAAVPSVVKLLPDLFDCGEVLLVFDARLGFLWEPVFPGQSECDSGDL